MKKDNDRLFLNTIMPLFLELATVLSGFVIPRLMLRQFGSEVHGLVQSITQFLAVISFLELGVGNVIRFNLYKPLVRHDKDQVSRVMVAANKFFRTIAFILGGYTVILMVLLPNLPSVHFTTFYTALLVFVMAIASFFQYYFGQVNQLLLSADQKGYIHYAAHIVTVLLNTVATVILVHSGASVHFVKFSTSLIFLLRPMFLFFYVRKHYDINYRITYTEEPIKQKWNGIAQHVAYVVLDNTDTLVLTILSSLKSVSIYSAYALVVNGIKKLMTTSVNGITAKLGAVIARDNKQDLDVTFNLTEWVIHTLAVLLFGCTMMLIVPFVSVYTRGITDANYIVPTFALLITLANAGHSFRLPYSILIQSAGHYRQTQKCYIIAAALNIVTSVILVKILGLVGVAIGTLAAMLYQTIWMAYYCYANILHRGILLFWKQFGLDTVTLALIWFVLHFFQFSGTSYLDWVMYAIPVSGVILAIVAIMNVIFYHNLVQSLFHQIKKKAG